MRSKARAAPPLLLEVRRRLRAAADPERAAQTKAYLKSAMPMWGVSVPAIRAICKEVFAGAEIGGRAAWERTALGIWSAATHREERYAAILWTGDRRAEELQTTEALPLYDRLIREGAWWDLVDEIATHRLPLVLDAEPAAAKRAMLRWAGDDDVWIRRSAILCQVSRKGRTDRDLLARAIAPSLGRREFFLRKAIGWALRAYAKVEPGWVVAYVADREAELSPLSKREALRHVEPR
ncbi:MAG: DNA alkylation repair protein [Myxococcales bacterium]|nr:DNA alkylation repair protein [Myxococcales bacterium]